MALLDPRPSLIADLASWARTKRGKYPYKDCADCAFAQFLRETGRCSRPHVRERTWADNAGNIFVLPEPLVDALACKPHTFGELAKRLERFA